MKSEKKEKNVFVIVVFVLVVILVLFFPKIYDFIENFNVPKIEDNSNKNIVEETKEVDEETLSSLHFPIMRSNIYENNTYYNLDKFTIKNMSNNDILYNAFLDIYEGNMTSYEGVGSCTTISKQFDEEYIKLRIKNILGKDVEYNLESFYVFENSNTTYVGEWNYDSMNKRFIYNGLCSSKATDTKYYDLEQFIKAEYNEDNIEVYYYVGFAKVVGSSYTIYSDSSMTKEIGSGELLSLEDLNNIFASIDKNKKNTYKYVFDDTLCTYSEYCLYEGMWVHDN